MARIVVIIPTYNEAENIGYMINVLIRKEFPQIEGNDMRLLIVDDNSPDGTAKIVRERMNFYNNLKGKKVIQLLTGKKEGLGIAFARGMRYAMDKMEADAVVEMDADFQHDPADVKRLVAEFDKGYDYIIGSRYIKGGSIPKEWEFYRKFMSWAGSVFARFTLLLFQVHDATSGFKLTRVKGFLDSVNLGKLISRSYAYKIQLLYEIYKDRLAKVKEIPIEFHFRERGSSKIESEDFIESLKVVIVLFFRSRFFKFVVVGTIGFIINATGLELIRRLGVFVPVAESFSYLKETKLFLLSQPTAWSAALAAEIAIISNFTFNNLWTFAKERIENPLKIIWKFLEFNITSAGAILIQFVVIGSAVTFFSDTTQVRQIALVFAVVFLIVPYNYTMYNVVIWKRWRIPVISPLLEKLSFSARAQAPF